MQVHRGKLRALIGTMYICMTRVGKEIVLK